MGKFNTSLRRDWPLKAVSRRDGTEAQVITRNAELGIIEIVHGDLHTVGIVNQKGEFFSSLSGKLDRRWRILHKTVTRQYTGTYPGIYLGGFVQDFCDQKTDDLVQSARGGLKFTLTIEIPGEE